MTNRIRPLGRLLLASVVAGACTSEAPAVATPAQTLPATAAPPPVLTAAPTATVAPTPVPSRSPTPTPLATIPSTAELTPTAPKGATTIRVFSNQIIFEPNDVSVKAGKVVLFIENVRGDNLRHNFVLGPALRQRLVATPTIAHGSALVLTIDDLPAGTYAFWCTVDDHVQYGMQGTLTAK